MTDPVRFVLSNDHKKMPRILLWDLLRDDAIVLVLPCPSGVVVTNQTGGTCCYHPEIEGIVVPLPRAYDSANDELYEMAWNRNDRDAVAQFLRDQELDDLFAPVDGAWPTELGRECVHEAWVPVRVIAERHLSRGSGAAGLEAFRDRVGFLAYSNSD